MSHLCYEDRGKWLTISWKWRYIQVSRDGSMSQALLTKKCGVIIYYFDGSSNYNKCVQPGK